MDVLEITFPSDIFVSFYYLYNYLNVIILIISRFSFIILNLTKYLYNKYKFIYIINKIKSKFNYL